MTLRRLIKTGTACAAHWTGADRWVGRLEASHDRPLVIGYHRVVEDVAGSAEDAMPGIVISRRMLEQQLDWIGRRFQFLSLDELGERLDEGAKFDTPAAVVTFDDGYRDFYDQAYPLLTRKGIPAAIFVVTDLIGSSRLQIYDKLYLLLRRAFAMRQAPPRELAPLGVWPARMKRGSSAVLDPYMTMRALIRALSQSELLGVIDALEAEFGIDERRLTPLHSLDWEMLDRMHRSGIIIGSHTRSHVLLANESREKMREELAGSKKALEERLGVDVEHFAYPDGQFSPMVVDAVLSAGYRFGYAGCRHSDPSRPLLTIPRTFLWENSCLDLFGNFSPAVMSCQASGMFDFVDRCGQNHN